MVSGELYGFIGAANRMEEFEKLRAKFKHVAVLMATGWQLDNPMAFSYQAKSKLSF